ncbi:MAG: aminotransferase class III-fold pyridoxal phosphate-dependent enzyme [Steroidobacteraceae bacterium]
MHPIPLIAIAALLLCVKPLIARLQLARAKHRSLEGHARWSRRLARLLPFYEYDETRFFNCDGAPPEVAEQRRSGFATLTQLFRTRYARSAGLTAAAAEHLPDLQFTARYRVPFQFSRYVREHLKSGSLVAASAGSTLTDCDGNVQYDVTGSYGVNVFGNDFYKECIRAAVAQADALGAVLGSYHPCIIDNVSRLRAISGLDEVSFHMSGTEAIMQAVRLARYHTGRRHVVRFCGAYHGWWGDVQPGVGNPTTARDTYTLRDMSAVSLAVLRSRRDIACVLVNPLQALHTNRSAPGDSALVDSSRRAGVDRAAYSNWLQQLRAVCSERGIVLIFDEIFVGFRLAPRGAQEYFGIQADMVTYGKTVAGGLPIGVVCGKHELMQRFRPDRPADVCFARGTFNSHPYVMTAMNAFLRRLETLEIQDLYRDLDETWNARAAALNARLRELDLPLQVANLSTIWTVYYTQAGRYNWMFQYYLKAHGLALSWVGSGRLIFTLTCTAEDFAAIVERFTAAALQMQRDGWWWSSPQLTNRSIRRTVLREMLQARWPWVMGSISSPRSR